MSDDWEPLPLYTALLSSIRFVVWLRDRLRPAGKKAEADTPMKHSADPLR